MLPAGASRPAPCPPSCPACPRNTPSAPLPAPGRRRYHYVHADADALADRSKAVTVKANSSVGPLSLVLAPPPGNRSRLWQIPIYNMCLRRCAGARLGVLLPLKPGAAARLPPASRSLQQRGWVGEPHLACAACAGSGAAPAFAATQRRLVPPPPHAGSGRATAGWVRVGACWLCVPLQCVGVGWGWGWGCVCVWVGGGGGGVQRDACGMRWCEAACSFMSVCGKPVLAEGRLAGAASTARPLAGRCRSPPSAREPLPA